MLEGLAADFPFYWSIFLGAFVLQTLCPIGRGTRQQNQQGHASDHDGNTDQVSRSEVPDKILVLRIIAAECFDERTQGSIAHEVRGKDLAIKFLSAEKPGQAQIQREVQERLIKLGRMDR